ncbi:MAG: MlaD family protein [Chitinophagaceae bacterium]
MNASSSQKIKIGLFVVVTALILVAGVFLIGSKQNMFTGTFNVYGNFRNTGGLQVGNAIRFGGVNVGTVKNISIINDTTVRVDMILQTDKREFFKQDALVTIGSDGLMGDKLLEIQPGSPGSPQLKVGGQIRTSEPTDFGVIISKFSKVADNAEVITSALADMALQIKNGNGSISRLLYKDELALALKGTLNNTKELTGTLQNITQQVESGKGSMGELLYTDHLSRGLDSTVAGANAAMTTIQHAAYNFSENMRALQGNYFLRGYFRKKAQAKADSLQNADTTDDDAPSDAELRKMRDETDQELQRRAAQPGKAIGK